MALTSPAALVVTNNQTNGARGSKHNKKSKDHEASVSRCIISDVDLGTLTASRKGGAGRTRGTMHTPRTCLSLNTLREERGYRGGGKVNCQVSVIIPSYVTVMVSSYLPETRCPSFEVFFCGVRYGGGPCLEFLVLVRFFGSASFHIIFPA